MTQARGFRAPLSKIEGAKPDKTVVQPRVSRDVNTELKIKAKGILSIDLGLLSENQRILEKGSKFWDSVTDWGQIESLRFELGVIRKIRVGELGF